MSLLSRGLKGSIELSLGQFLAYGCSFVRLAILARLLSIADFGIGATFVLTIALLEMSSNMSLNMLIEFGEAFDYTFADFRGWCEEAGFVRFEKLHLAGPASAGVAYK